jgi:UDP-glucose 4-epimerase
MRILITGATGFIGSCVLERLASRGHTVRVIVRPQTLSDPEKAKRLRLPGVEIVPGDMGDSVEKLTRAAKGVDAVCHLALAFHKGLFVLPRFLQANVPGTENLLQASVAEGVRRFVFTSSVLVYGYTQAVLRNWPVSEEAPLLGASGYSSTKRLLEQRIADYGRRHGLEYAILRVSNVYGPHAAYYERFLRYILRHPVRSLNPENMICPFLEYGGHSHWVHVCDAADSVIVAATNKVRLSDVFNVAGQKAICRRDLVELVHDIAQQNGRVQRFADSRDTQDHPVRIYDIRKANAQLGFVPRVGLRQGLGEMLQIMHSKRRVGIVA